MNYREELINNIKKEIEELSEKQCALTLQAEEIHRSIIERKEILNDIANEVTFTLVELQGPPKRKYKDKPISEVKSTFEPSHAQSKKPYVQSIVDAAYEEIDELKTKEYPHNI